MRVNISAAQFAGYRPGNQDGIPTREADVPPSQEQSNISTIN